MCKKSVKLILHSPPHKKTQYSGCNRIMYASLHFLNISNAALCKAMNLRTKTGEKLIILLDQPIFIYTTIEKHLNILVLIFEMYIVSHSFILRSHSHLFKSQENTSSCLFSSLFYWCFSLTISTIRILKVFIRPFPTQQRKVQLASIFSQPTRLLGVA